jgi:hypothetical protein
MGKCKGDDLKFTFIGRVGLVTAVDNSAIIPQVWVSFNYGRTSYQFAQSDVKLETTSKSMYGKSCECRMMVVNKTDTVNL